MTDAGTGDVEQQSVAEVAGATPQVENKEPQTSEDARGKKILSSLMFEAEQYVDNVTDLESGPFSRAVMDKFDKRFEGSLEVGTKHRS